MIDNKIIFSIIIPVYNTVNELDRCVRSILSQTFKSFEVILVDDGSTDGSDKECDRLSALDSRVKTLHKKNGGCSDARNAGINISQGEYLIFVDSDDMWTDDEALNNINKLLDEGNTDVVVFGVSIYDSDEKLVKSRIPADISGDKKTVFSELIKNNQYISTSYVKALNRKFFIDNNLYFPKGVLSEDVEWSSRIMLLCKNIKVYPYSFYKRIYRDEGSITSNIGKKNITDIINQIESGTAAIKNSVTDEDMLQIYYSYWSYQYSIILGLVRKIRSDSEYKTIINRLKALDWLLNYTMVGSVKKVSTIYKLFGMKFTVWLLDKYLKMR